MTQSASPDFLTLVYLRVKRKGLHVLRCLQFAKIGRHKAIQSVKVRKNTKLSKHILNRF